MWYEELTRKGGMGGMVFAVVGGIMAILISFTFVNLSGGAYAGYDVGFITIFDLVETYNYLMAIPVFGIMAIILGAVGYQLQKRQVAYVLPLFGILLIIIPFLFIVQFAGNTVFSMIEVFYFRTSIDMGAAGTINIMWFFFGGVFCWISGSFIILGGKSLISNINPEYVGKGPELEEAIKAKEMAQPDYVDLEQVERLRQERLAAKEQEEAERTAEKEAKERAVMCSIYMDVPASIAIGQTETVSVKITNQGAELVKTLEFDLEDLAYYFDIQGSLKFSNIGPGMEMVGSVKITPKEDEEGIYPILIEITEDGRPIERRFSIRVEGRESY